LDTIAAGAITENQMPLMFHLHLALLTTAKATACRTITCKIVTGTTVAKAVAAKHASARVFTERMLYMQLPMMLLLLKPFGEAITEATTLKDSVVFLELLQKLLQKLTMKLL